MKTIILTFLVFYSLTGFSQDSTKVNPTKWTMGFCGSVNYFDNIKAQTGFNHKYTYNKIGLRGGIDFTYHLSKRSAISTGVFRFNVRYKADYVWIVSLPNDPAIPVQTNTNTNYIDIPLTYNFSIISRDKITFYTTTGVILSVLHSAKGKTTYMNNSVRKFDYINASFYSLQLGLGFQYNFNKRTGIKIEPSYRIFSKGFDTIMDQSPTAFSVNVGIVSKFDWKCFFKKGTWQPLPYCD